MTTKSKIAVDDLVAYVNGLFPSLSLFEQRLSIELYRLLLEGKPVPRQRLVPQLECTVDTINRTLDAWPGIFFDEQRRIVGYWGLALQEAYTGPHTIAVGAQSLSAWCAWDTLLLPMLLGQTVEIESKTPGGSRVYLRVTPHRVEHKYPIDLQMSFLLPDPAAVRKDVVNSFCHFIHFFSSPEAGRGWVARHSGTFLLALDDAHDLARRRNLALYRDVLVS